MGQSSVVSTSTKLVFRHTVDPLVPTKYIDVGQCLSIINRRSYRQGMNYAVAGCEAVAQNGGRVAISKVPTTWVADNATTKAFEFWKDQRAEVLKEQPSLKAKWSDFKVFLDKDHVSLGTAGNMIPTDGVNDFLKGEWDASQIVFPVTGGSGGTGAAAEMTMHIVGDNIPVGNFTVAKTSFSLIEAYANSRRTPQSPDPSSTGVSETTNPYATLTAPDSLYQDIAENVLDNNRETPYDLDDYPGGELNAPYPQWEDTMIVRDWGDSTQWSSDTMGPFVAPLGLLRVNFADFEAGTQLYLTIDLVPGKYKGVLAERGL